jgi:DNA polymerase-3 subunit delta'
MLPSRLPATIRSRCQTVRLPQPSRAASLAWLRSVDARADWDAVLDIVGENPLTALEVEPAAAARLRADTVEGLERTLRRQGNPAELAERWSKSELPLRLRLFETWLTNRIRAAVSKSVITAEMRPEAHLPAAKYVMNIGPTFELLEGVRELQSALEGPINRSLALELLLVRLAA